MGKMQRTKGRAAEQEIARIIRDWLGLDIKRNWQAQSAEGGADLTGIPGWAAEVKRAKAPSLNAWWQQTIEQAEKAKAKPVLLFRLDGFGRGLDDVWKWQAVVRLKDIGCEAGSRHPAQMTLFAWLKIVREGMANDADTK